MSRRVTEMLAVIVVSVVAARCAATAQRAPSCSKDAWDPFVARYKAAQARFQQRDPEPILALWSHEPDVTLMGALGGHERGWDTISRRLSRISAMNDGTHADPEMVTEIRGADVGMWVQLEHITQRTAAGAFQRNRLRVTHVARCEQGSWRIVHRHADYEVESKLPPP